jgi:hypothetical protein
LRETREREEKEKAAKVEAEAGRDRLEEGPIGIIQLRKLYWVPTIGASKLKKIQIQVGAGPNDQ